MESNRGGPLELEYMALGMYSRELVRNFVHASNIPSPWYKCLDPQAVDPILKQIALQHFNYLEGTYHEKREF